jgi:hypothetical protein
VRVGGVLAGLFWIVIGALFVTGPLRVKRGTGSGFLAVPAGRMGYVLWSMLAVLLGLVAIARGLATLVD